MRKKQSANVDKACEDFVKILGADRVKVEEYVRRSYMGDVSWLALYINYREELEALLPDVVVFPRNSQEVSEVLRIARKHRIPVIPWGGGSGTQEGVLPIFGGVAVDMKFMDKVEVNEEGMYVSAEAGVLAYELETKLNLKGYTTGHYPASMYSATVGGMLAARSAGVASTKYGKIEDMVLGLQIVLPNGEIFDTGIKPKFTGAVGPDLIQLFVGSEGTLGIITKAALQMHVLPEERRFAAFTFPRLENGYKAVVEILKRISPAVVRLYDEEEILKSKLKTITPPDEARGALLLLIFDGFKEVAELEERVSKGICEEHGGTWLGEGPAKNWWNGRFHHYYPPLSPSSNLPIIYGTIDVSTTFDKLLKLYQRIKEKLYKKYESYDLQLASHFSHWSKSGGMIYMRFYIMKPPEDPWAAIELHDEVYEDAIRITAEMGGVINDHHGIGFKLAKMMKLQYGDVGMDVLRKIKRALDPDNIMNPGKLGL